MRLSSSEIESKVHTVPIGSMLDLNLLLKHHRMLVLDIGELLCLLLLCYSLSVSSTTTSRSRWRRLLNGRRIDLKSVDIDLNVVLCMSLGVSVGRRKRRSRWSMGSSSSGETRFRSIGFIGGELLCILCTLGVERCLSFFASFFDL